MATLKLTKKPAAPAKRAAPGEEKRGPLRGKGVSRPRQSLEAAQAERQEKQAAFEQRRTAEAERFERYARPQPRPDDRQPQDPRRSSYSEPRPARPAQPGTLMNLGVMRISAGRPTGNARPTGRVTTTGLAAKVRARARASRSNSVRAAMGLRRPHRSHAGINAARPGRGRPVIRSRSRSGKLSALDHLCGRITTMTMMTTISPSIATPRPKAIACPSG
jgi:23S rRNA pseudouridine2604 synthase